MIRVDAAWFAVEALEYFVELYKIEREAREHKLDANGRRRYDSNVQSPLLRA